jgi:hypothetical protein
MTTSETPITGSWVEAVSSSCSLPTAAKPLRLAEFDDLFASEITAVARASTTLARFTLRPDPEVAARVAELSSREAQCCSFFEFSLTMTAGELEWTVRVPDAHTDILDGVIERAHPAVDRGSA